MRSPARTVRFEIREDTPRAHIPPYAWKRLRTVLPSARVCDYYTARDGWDVKKIKRTLQSEKSKRKRKSPVRGPSPRRLRQMQKTLPNMR